MKKLLIGIAVVIILLIAAALVAPFLIPTDTYKTRIIALVKQSTGRDLRIDGPVSLSFLPQLALEANSVALANVPGAHDSDMLELKRLQVQLRVLPLLHGDVTIARFVLDQPVISLEVDKNGRANWVFAQAAEPKAASAPAAPSTAPAASRSGTAGSALSELHLDDVRLNNGKLSYRDDRTGKAEEVDDVNMKVSLPDLDSPLAADGSATWHSEKLSLTIGVAKPRAVLAGGASQFGIKLSGNPLNVGFDGTMTGLPPAKLDGALDLTVPSLRGLAQWAGSPLPPGGGLGKLAIKGKFAMAGQKYDFDDAAIAVDAINATGSVGIDLGGARPALKGTLAVDKLDANPYLPPETPSSGTAAASGSPSGQKSAGQSAAAPAGWSDAPIDVSALGLANADFALKANQILYRKFVIGPSELDVHLLNSKLAVDLSKLSLYQGQGTAKLAVDGAAAIPAITMALDASGVQIGPLAAAASGTDRISGTGRLAFDVAGTGKSQRALVNALNGRGSLALTNGEIKGVNLIALAESATSPLTGKSGDNETSFGALTGTFTITNGILKNDDLQMKSGLVPITGAGTVDLPNRTTQYHVTVSLAGTVGVPILVSGPWDDLSYRPDVAGALGGLAKTPGNVLNSLGKTLGGSQGGSGSGGSNPTQMLKGLFGK